LEKNRLERERVDGWGRKRRKSREAEHRWIGGERRDGVGRWHHQSQQREMAARKWLPLFAVGPPSFGFMSLLVSVSIHQKISRSCPGLAPPPNHKK
jgi:hypothetical protein